VHAGTVKHTRRPGIGVAPILEGSQVRFGELLVRATAQRLPQLPADETPATWGCLPSRHPAGTTTAGFLPARSQSSHTRTRSRTALAVPGLRGSPQPHTTQVTGTIAAFLRSFAALRLRHRTSHAGGSARPLPQPHNDRLAHMFGDRHR